MKFWCTQIKCKHFLKTCRLVLAIVVFSYGFSIEGLSQCGFLGKLENGNVYLPRVGNQTVGIGNAAYLQFGIKTGGTYHWDVCGGVSYDSQLTGYNGSTANWYNDDGCSTQSTIDWGSNFTGTENVQIDVFNCNNWLAGYGSATLNYRCSPPASPSAGTAGNGVWNVYCYDAGDAAGGSGAWSSNYAGYYTESNLSFSTQNRWGSNNGPSDASGFQGCNIPYDSHSWRAVRTGFSCATYQIDINGHDDRAQLLINGAIVWDHNGCCDAHTNVWTGELSASDIVEFRCSEGGGGSNGQITFTTVGASGSGNPATFGSNTWNAYAYSCNNTNLGSDTYDGFYVDGNLSFNSGNVWSGGTGGTPSSVVAGYTYTGYPVSVDYHGVVYKRQGFPCAVYRLDIPTHDDDVYVFVNGSQVFVHNGCCDAHTGIWTGVLGSSDNVEYRWFDGVGGSQGALNFTNVGTTLTAGSVSYSGSTTACTGYDPPAMSCSAASGGASAAVTNGSTSYQWQLNGSNISGATGTSYDPGALTAGTYAYRCVQTDKCGTAVNSTNTITITINGNTATAGTISPASSSVNLGSAVTINNTSSATAASGTSLFIRWYRTNSCTNSTAVDLGTTNSQTLSGDIPPSAGTWTYIRRAWSSCGAEGSPAYYDATTTVTVTSTSGTPSTFGSNTWNAYAYCGNNTTLTSDIYQGYYVDNALSFNSGNVWVSGTTGTPSSVVSGYTYSGGTVGADYHAVVYKRQGFPCAVYQLDIPTHDDDVYVFVNGSQVFVHNGCCDAHSNIWTGVLGTSDNIEYRWFDGVGGSQGAMNFTTVTTALNAGTIGYSGSTSACAGYDPPAFTSGSAASGGASAAVNNGTTAYQWQLNGVDIGGATGTTYDPGALSAGTYTYTRKVTDKCSNTASTSGVTITITPTVGTPTAITVSSGTEPTCQLTNGTTTTTYATTATNNTGFNWSLSNASAGSINSSGVMTWANGFSGSVNIQVTASGCNGPSSQVVRSVTVTPTVGTPTAITVSAGTEPTCQLTNGTTTTTYSTTATNNTGFNWSLSNASAGSINSSGVMTWANGFSGSVNIQVTASGCNGPSSQVVRSVTITPTVGTPTAITISSGTEPTCQLTNGTTTTTYATTATNSTGFNWSLSNASAGSINSSGVMTWANGFSGSVNIQVTASGCNGPSSQVVRSVTVTPTVGTPTAITVSAGTQPTCQLTNGTTTTTYATTATNSTGFNWTLSNASAGSINSSGVMTWANGFSGSVNIQVTASGCNGPSAQTIRAVTITPTVGTPTAITISSGTEPTCQLTNGTTTTTYATTATNNTGFNWSLSNASAGSINSSGVMTWANGFSGSVNIQVTASGCNGPSAQTIRTVNITPTVGTPTAITISSGTQPTCQLTNGTTTTTYATTATNSTGFNWSLSNASAGSINSSGVMTWANGFSGSVNIQVTASGCNGPSAQTIRAVSITPTVGTPTAITVSSGTEPTCQLTNGTTTTTYATTATNNTGLNWTISNASAGSINSSGVMAWANGFSGSVNIQVTASGCNGPSAQTIRTVNITPTVGTPTAITISSGTQPTCQLTNGTTTTTYATTATNNTGFNWSLSNASAGSINASTGVMTWANGFSGSVNIQVTASGCNGPSAQVTRTVTIGATVGTPTAITISAGTEPTCQLTNGTTTTTYATTATNNTGLNWTISNASAGSINSSGVMAWANGFSGSVNIQVTASGCNGPSAQTTRTVFIAAPIGTVTATLGSNPICEGSDLHLSATVSAGTGITYNWSGPGSYSANNNQTPTRTSVTIAGNTEGVYTVSAVNACGTVTGSTAALNVQPYLITRNISSNANTPLCEGSDLQLTTTYTGTLASNDVTWSWVGPNSFTANTANATITNVTLAAAGTYTLTAGNGCGSVSPPLPDVQVDQHITANADNTALSISDPAGGGGYVRPICNGSSVFTLYGNNPSPGSGSWSQLGTPHTTFGNANNPTTTATHSGSNTTETYEYTITNGTCTSTSDVRVYFDPAINVVATLSGCALVSPDKDLIQVSGSGGTVFTPHVLTFTPSSGSTPIAVTGNTKIYSEVANGSTYNYTVSDDFTCSSTAGATSKNGHPTNIPYSSSTSGAHTITTSCYDIAYNQWVTFRDNNNDAILAIKDSGVDLSLVTVTMYKDAIVPQVLQSNTANNCQGNYSTAMQRHFKITSPNSNPNGSFHNTSNGPSAVYIRLYFSQAELDSLILASQANDQPASNNAQYACSHNDNIYDINGLYVTKYSGNNEDGDYSNNDPSGIYKVYGSPTQLPTQPDGPLKKSSGGFDGMYSGSNHGHHYVELIADRFSELWLDGSQNGTALPVEMIYLQADAVNNSYIKVSWGTDLEINNNGFAVEKSTDGQNWQAVGWVDGNGNSTVRHDYNYNDYEVRAGQRYYYRLKQVDNNGVYQYTGIVSAVLTGELTFTVMDFIPNPATSTTSLVVTSTTDQQIEVNIYDIIGQKAISGKYQLNKGSNKIEFNVANLAAGTYTAAVSSANETYSKKLVITK